MALSGLHTISIYDNNDDGFKFSGGNTPTAGTVVQMNNIKDSEGELLIGQPLEGQNNPSGDAVYAGEESILEFNCYDAGVLAQLQAWQKAGRRLNAVGAGPKNLQWYEPTTIKVLPRNFFVSGRKTLNLVRMYKSGGDLEIYNNTNLLAYLGWADADGDGYADNYSNSGFSSPTFVSGLQTVTSSFSVSLGFRGNIVFPLSGISMSLSLYTVSSSGSPFLRIDTRNYEDEGISSDTISYSPAAVRRVNLITSASTYIISSSLCGGLAATKTAEFKFPALTTNAQPTPGDKFLND